MQFRSKDFLDRAELNHLVKDLYHSGEKRSKGLTPTNFRVFTNALAGEPGLPAHKILLVLEVMIIYENKLN